MKATISKIEPPRIGTDGVLYRRVWFLADEFSIWKNKNWPWHTHLCPDHKNFARWKNLLEVGVVLENLDVMPDGKTIDADSKPRLVSRPEKQTDLFK
jgi:hypothetical protein